MLGCKPWMCLAVDSNHITPGFHYDKVMWDFLFIFLIKAESRAKPWVVCLTEIESAAVSLRQPRKLKHIFQKEKVSA